MGMNKDIVVKIRKIVRHGNSFYIAIPREFMIRHDLKAGDHLPILASHILKIIPMKEQ